MLSIEQKLHNAVQKCQRNGQRLTNKRKQILTALLKADKAISAYDIMDFCKREFDTSIPAMSVYRILDFLRAQGLIHKLNLANKYLVCSHISCNHQHQASQFLICISCYKVKEISINQLLSDEVSNQANQAGFDLVSPKLEINCICITCKKTILYRRKKTPI